MSYGPSAYFVTRILSGATASSALDLGRSWGSMYLVIGSTTSNSQYHIKASETLSGTYRRVKHPVINSATTAAPVDYTIMSSATSCFVPIPSGYRFLQVEATATIDSGESYSIVCGE